MRRTTFQMRLWQIGGALGLFALIVFIAGMAGAERLFEALKAVSAPILGVGAVLLTNAYQRRSGFLVSLREEWAEIVKAKAAMMGFCRQDAKTQKEAVGCWVSLSVVIDRMRVLYRNVGETDTKIGFYPYEPLHDIRKIWEGSVLPTAAGVPTDPVDWKKVEREIEECFGSLREVFLMELELEEPEWPIVSAQTRRLKTGGWAPPPWRKSELDRQRSGTPE